IPIEKIGHLRIGIQPILELGQTVSLVLIPKILHWNVPLLEGRDDLFRFSDGYARIIGSMNDHHRTPDPVHVVNGADARQEFAMFAKIAILLFSMCSSIGACL